MNEREELLRTLEAARDVMAAEIDPVEIATRQFDPARRMEHGRRFWNVRMHLEDVIRRHRGVPAPVAPREAAPMPQADGC
jgi:hypothetical protein